MSKADEYRGNARECERMARTSTDPTDKALWLEMAQDWLRMTQARPTQGSKRFDAAQRAQGTGQAQSIAEH